MTKHLTILLFLFLQNIAFGQLIITGGLPGDTSPRTCRFEIDTLRMNGDNVYYTVSRYEHAALVHKEQQFFPGKDGYVVFHGKAEQWYIDGSKKLEGQFVFGKKKGLWKYWDEKGNFRQDIDRESFGVNIIGVANYYIDGVPVEIRE